MNSFSPIKALIFDFDGLILETEGPVFQSWQELYQDHGCEVSFEKWATIIGSSENFFDPFTLLEEQLGKNVDRKTLDARRKEREIELVMKQAPLPGVEAYLIAARQLGLKTAVASSSSRAWVAGHLQRLEMLHYFDYIKTRDDVERTKPDPALFLAAMQAVEVQSDEAIIFEDSPNGIAAANAAGVFVVAVPNPLTRDLDLSQADLVLDSLADMPLDELLVEVSKR